MNKEIRRIVATFQCETQSSNVLDFITWLENREILENSKVETRKYK